MAARSALHCPRPPYRRGSVAAPPPVVAMPSPAEKPARMLGSPCYILMTEMLRNCYTPPTSPASVPVIPAQAGIRAFPYPASFRRKPESGRFPYPASFRRKPESSATSVPRHSGASRHPGVSSIHRHSGASRNPGIPNIYRHPDDLPPVIPAPHPSFRRKPESSAAPVLHLPPQQPPARQTTRKIRNFQ